MPRSRLALALPPLALAATLVACGGGGEGAAMAGDAGAGGARRGGGGGAGGPGGFGGDSAAAVPVEVIEVARRPVAAYIETNGVLEAENEVDIVARIAGPIVELAAEEGMQVRKGQLLARIQEAEARAQVEIAEVRLRDAERSFERAKTSWENELISEETYEQVLAEKEAAEAQLTDQRIRLGYTHIEAPFSAIVIERDVKLAENVTVNQKLFRISDFDPLLCPIQVPEQELARLRVGQPAHLTVGAWPDQRFPAKVLRISPVVDAATGTIRVTLEVQGQGKLRPGMFASVFLEVDTHGDALAIPRAALALESLGDTVFVARDDVAVRRSVQLGYEEADVVEVVSGLEEGERVIVVGQEGLSDGTPIRVMAGPGAAPPPARAERPGPPEAGAPPAPGGRGPRGDGPPDAQRLEQMKQRMRDRGLSEQEIEERLRRIQEQGGGRPEGR